MTVMILMIINEDRLLIQRDALCVIVFIQPIDQNVTYGVQLV